MTLLAPLGLLAGLLALPVIALHVLRPRREREMVSSTYLWRDVEEPVAPSRPWQRLRWNIPLLLQLLLVALLAFVLAHPVRTSATTLADHTVFVVDTSASMLASDGDPDRLELAKQRVRDLLDELPTGGSASLVVASGDPEVLIVDSTDREAVVAAVDRLRPTSGVADFDAAFTLAESAVSASRRTGWVLVSDGGVGLDQQRLAPPGLRYVPVGSRDVNRAITALSAVVTDGELSALVTVSNEGGPAAMQELRVDVDGVTVERRELELPAGETVEVDVPIPSGSRVEAFLDGADLLLNDNQRAALVPLATDLRVRVATDDPDGAFFVEQVLDALGAEIVRGTDDVDLVIYDGVDVPASPAAPFISIASRTPPVGISVVGAVERPIPTFVADDVVVRDVDVTRTAIATAQRLDAGVGTVLIGAAEGEPLLIEGRTGNIRWFHLAFELEASNLPVEVAYPILFARMVSDLTISDDVPASAVTGTRLPSLATASTVTSPRGVATTVSAGARMPILDEDGFWTVEHAEGQLRPVAAVFPSSESDLAVAPELPGLAPAAPQDGDAAATSATTTDSLVPWLVLAIIAVLVAEFLVSGRRRRVPSTQRVAAHAFRVAIVLLLVGALVGVQWTRPNETVRAVIVVDVSDSLGADGRARVDRYVDDVLSDADVSDVAIVQVGRTVRVAKPFDATTGGAAESPAGDGTDLVRGLRLGVSLLDGSTSERIVVVSDGVHTTGDLQSEVARVGDLDIALDVHQVVVDRAQDVGVDAVSAPSRVSEDESYRVTGSLVAASAQRVTVELVRNDVVAERRDVDLVPGSNDVAFDVVAGDNGLDRYAVRVADSADSVPENDVATTAVTTAGPPRVLVIEGTAGNSTAVVDALRARAIDTDVAAVDAFPASDELTAFGSVVLVDVDAGSLSEAHLDALDVHVRDQGNGLVVIGGTNAFALGGYADTRLEDLLPIESRAEDPTRQATVAEVLLIDASESMGACHCAPIDGEANDDPFAGEIVEGGVNKTDISRTAAERAIGALSVDDEVGVLAFSGTSDWIVPLQPVGDATEAADELARLTPSGETRISPALDTAAEALRESSKELKHIILFSDGFSPELFDENSGFGDPAMQAGLQDLEQQAADLADEGITVSVVATGEGAAPLLEAVAIAGNGRFYPGRDLDEIPEIFVEEARIASRSFINEGEYVPVVTSTAAPVRGLEAAPALSGFLAATPKDTADVMLQVGEFSDPLLASWRIGLGTVTTWTADSGERWAAPWAGWDGWADFWSAVVRDSFPLQGAEGYDLSSEIRGESLFLELVSDAAWPAGSVPVAQVTDPDGATVEVELERVSDTTFAAALPAAATGSYSVAATVAGDEDDAEVQTRLATAVATRSYPVEYRPAEASPVDLAGLSDSIGGRGEILATQVLDLDGLAPGKQSTELRWPFLLIAALLLPIDLALHSVRLRTLAADLRASRSRRGSPPPPRPTPRASPAGSAP